MFNPIEWFSWIYGKLFAGIAPIWGYLTVCVIAALCASVLWAIAVEKYKDQHPSPTTPNGAAPAATSASASSSSTPASSPTPAGKKEAALPPTKTEQKSSGDSSPNVQQVQGNSGGTNIQQQGKTNIAQVGNNNQANVNEFDANKPQVTFDVDGLKRTQRPGKITVDDTEFATYRELMKAMNGQDWNTVLGIAKDALKRAPEWPTVHYALGKAYINLCDRQNGLAFLKSFVESVKERDDYRPARNDANALIGLINRGEMPPQC